MRGFAAAAFGRRKTPSLHPAGARRQGPSDEFNQVLLDFLAQQP